MKKQALVTGYDNSEIARVTADLLISHGYNVVASCSNGMMDEKMFACCESAAESIRFDGVDYASEESIGAFVGKLANERFDAIVNCYATLAVGLSGGIRHEFFDFDYRLFCSVLCENIAATAAICIGLKDSISAGGCIVNVTSSAADEGAFATISYNASKAAVKNLSMSLANCFGPYNGVRVNCVAPGWIPQSEDVAAGDIVELSSKVAPLLRYGTADNVAAAVLSLIENAFANNVTYTVDGGLVSSNLMYLLESADLRGNKIAGITSDLTKRIVEVREMLGQDIS